MTGIKNWEQEEAACLDLSNHGKYLVNIWALPQKQCDVVISEVQRSSGQILFPLDKARLSDSLFLDPC